MYINIDKLEHNNEVIELVNMMADKYREELRKVGTDKRGELYNFKIDLAVNNKELEVEFILPDYWVFAEHGRRPGKMPPVNIIDHWIKIKHIVPHAVNGKIPSVKQLAYVIARNIGRHGTKPTNALKKAESNYDSILHKLKSIIIDEVNDQLCEKINDETEKWQ